MVNATKKPARLFPNVESTFQMLSESFPVLTPKPLSLRLTSGWSMMLTTLVPPLRVGNVSYTLTTLND
jgi:hypothetical protein